METEKGVKTIHKKEGREMVNKQGNRRETQEREAQRKREEQHVRRAKLKEEGFPEPVSISESLVNSLSKEQQQILFRINELGEREQKLIDEINARRPTPSGVLQLPGGTVTVCETEDDWKVITLNSRSELKKVREEIVKTLNKALDYGLAHLGFIQRQCANYGAKP